MNNEILKNDFIAITTKTEYLFNSSDELQGYNVAHYHSSFIELLFFVILGFVCFKILTLYLLSGKKK